MKNTTAFSLAAAAVIALSSAAFAGAKEYQVTGPVVDVNDKMITVMKGKDRWEIDRASDTKVNGDVKVGDKVTVMYTMTAKTVDVKPGGDAKKEGAKKEGAEKEGAKKEGPKKEAPKK